MNDRHFDERLDPVTSIQPNPSYTIKVLGEIDPDWLKWFGIKDCHIRKDPDNPKLCIISGIQIDQSGLIDLIRQMNGLGITIETIQKENKMKTR